MAFVRMLGIIIKDKNIGKRVVPIVPDESRTFGMEGMFRQLGIWSQVGQLYTPQDAEQLMFYKEDKHGQVIQEGINEAGGMSDWIAAGTAYSTHGVPMIPFYIFYSMFGFQRVADLIWAAADQCTRGFLLGATAGRTTLNGEGLQHEDGHSQVFAATVPNCVSYDPTYAYEVAVIIQDGMKRMYVERENIFYYVTVMNENYEQPALPNGAEEDILKGMYLFQEGAKSKSPRVQLLGSGTIFREAVAAAELLRDDWNVEADLWSCPSFNELAREGQTCDRWNRLHPTETAKQTHVAKCLDGMKGPVIASTDYVRAFAEQIRAYISAPYTVLGVDGFGRSDTRENLRSFFEVNRYHIVLAALKGLADNGEFDAAKIDVAIAKYNINPDISAPWLV
jgi:pyruvate dehydrogenase E1 component